MEGIGSGAAECQGEISAVDGWEERRGSLVHGLEEEKLQEASGMAVGYGSKIDKVQLCDCRRGDKLQLELEALAY
jgi:hypothetical protein